MAMHELAREVPAATGPLDPDAPLPGEAMVDFAVRGALLTTLDRLQSAMEEYGSASANLADATMRDLEARGLNEQTIAAARVHLYAEGVPGTNEAQRQAHLAFRLANEPDVAAAHRAHEEAQHARILAEHRFRTVDATQKALRARLYALTALLAGG